MFPFFAHSGNFSTWVIDGLFQQNFACTLVESQCVTTAGDGAGHCWLGWEALSGTLNQLNAAFVTLLAVELAVSVCARWPKHFLSRSATSQLHFLR